MKPNRAWQLEDNEKKYIGYICPACKEPHVIPIGIPNIDGWQFNGNYEFPTLFPSVKIDKIGCHGNITDGKVFFANDCTNGFANQVLMIEYYDENLL